MGDNGELNKEEVKLIFKAELIDKKIKITFNNDIPHTLFYDRALRLASLELDNMLIRLQAEKAPKPTISILSNNPLLNMPKSIIDKLRGN